MKNKTIKTLALNLALVMSLTACGGTNSSYSNDSSHKGELDKPETGYEQQVNTNSEKNSVVITESSQNNTRKQSFKSLGGGEYFSNTYTYKGEDYICALDPSLYYIKKEYKEVSYEDGITTDSLFFLRFDGKTYLATEVIDCDKDNIIHKYYDLTTGEFLGQVLEINWYSRIANQLVEKFGYPDVEDCKKMGGRKPYKVSTDYYLRDFNYFGGRYGLGKNLCSANIISAKNFFKTQKITGDNIKALLEDSLILDAQIENYKYTDMEITCHDYKFIILGKEFLLYYYDNSYAYVQGTYTMTNQLMKFSIDGGEVLYGYRASMNELDCGYNIIYDITNGTYHDLSLVKYSCEGIETISISEILELASHSKNMDQNICYNKEDSIYYNQEDLYVYSCQSLDGSLHNYLMQYKESDRLNGDKYTVFDGGFTLAHSHTYENGEAHVKIEETGVHMSHGKVNSLKKFLDLNGLSQHFKNEYSSKQLNRLCELVENCYMKKAADIIDYENLSAKDIIVVDMSKLEECKCTIQNPEALDCDYYILVPNEYFKGLNLISEYVCLTGGKGLDAAVAARVDPNGNYISINGSMIIAYYENPQMPTITFDEFLSKVGATDLLPDLDGYTLEELNVISAQYTNDTGKSRRLTPNES